MTTHTETLHDRSAPVGALITSSSSVASHRSVKEVAERFHEDPGLEAVAVLDGERPSGLVMRSKLFITLSRRFALELFGKDPISALADVEPLIVSLHEPLDSALGRALSRPPQHVYDDLLVVDEYGCFAGLLAVKQLVIYQSSALANTVMQCEVADERTRELERINDAKTQFIATMSHELRSPVHAIILLADLLKSAVEQNSIVELKARLNSLIASALGLRAVITNILDLSKIEAGKMEVILRHFDPAEMIGDIAETVRVLVTGKPVTVEVACPSLPVTAVSDPDKVRQIIMNLAGNAAKFTEQGSIRLSLSVQGDRVAFSVLDTGRGIRKEDMGRLFNAFEQLSRRGGEPNEGTGLGLAISRSLATLLGGTITASSEAGAGSAFTLLLPLGVPARQEERYAAS